MLQPLNMESPNDSSFLQLRLIKRDDRRVKRMHVENCERNDLDRSESISRIPTSSLSRGRAKFGRGCSRTRDSIPQGSCVGPHTFTRDRNFERRRDDATMRRPSSPRLQRVMLATSERGVIGAYGHRVAQPQSRFPSVRIDAEDRGSCEFPRDRHSKRENIIF